MRFNWDRMTQLALASCIGEKALSERPIAQPHSLSLLMRSGV